MDIPRLKSWKTALMLCILVVMLMNSLIVFRFFLGGALEKSFVGAAHALWDDAVLVPFGGVDLKLYIVALDDVGGHGIGNTTHTVEGVLSASRVNATMCILTINPPPLSHGQVAINTNVTVVHDWNMYKEVVETCSNAIIVNAHGEIIPVPAGYTRETWVDRIADAMANRNATWVHTAGYPFYYYHHQESGEGEWKEEGFQRLMSHIGKDNVTCYPHKIRESDLIHWNTYTLELLCLNWVTSKTEFVTVGKPLYGPDWNNSIIMCIWGVDYAYMPGAVIKFGNQTHRFGFYVHIGANQTYDFYQIPTDRDFYRGYIGAAAAIWACAWRFAAEDAISEADTAIARAESEGRTNGLDEARKLVQRAKRCFETGENEHWYPYIAGNFWGTAILRAMEARDVADNAIKPSFVEVHALPLTILGVAGATTVTSLAIRWKRNSGKKEREVRREKWELSS